MSIKKLEVSAGLSKGPIHVDAHAGVLIPGVKFTVAFSLGQIEQGTAYKIKYALERWHWFNKELFGSQMRPPSFEITKNTDEINTFGTYTGGIRRLRLHPKLWQLPNESQCLGTLVHEMAHQYEMEHRHRPYTEDAHGATWQGIMAEVGLPIDAKYTGGRIAVQTIQEKRTVEKYSSQYVRRVDPEKLSTGINYGVYVNKIKGRAVPVVLVGNKTYMRNGVQTLPGFNAKTLRETGFHYFDLPSLFLPDALQLEDFPKELKSAAAVEKSRRVQRTMDLLALNEAYKNQ